MITTDKKTVFPKRCGVCQSTWNTRADFLDDPGLTLRGYQPAFDELEEGLFLFDHTCRNTLSVKAGEFLSLYDGPMFTDSMRDTDECPGYCRNHEDLRSCPAKCSCAYVREVLDLINNWKRRKYEGMENV